jgi:hypothetical protein
MMRQTGRARPTAAGLALRRYILPYYAFYVIFWGMGYPSVYRADPVVLRGPKDAKAYYLMTTQGWSSVNPPARSRILLPTLYRGVYEIIRHFEFGHWDKVLLAMLLVNSAIMAGAALLIMVVGGDLIGNHVTGFIGALMFGSSWTAVNLHMYGLLDSAEAFCVAATMLLAIRDRWAWTPLVIGIGVFAKETTLVFGVSFLAGWWVWARLRRYPAPRHGLMSLLGCIIAGAMARQMSLWLVGGEVYDAHRLTWERLAALPAGMLDCLLQRTWVYAFALLLPFGLPRVRRLAGPFLAGGLMMAAVAFMAGAYGRIGDNITRPMFDTLGMVLAISCGVFVHDLVRFPRVPVNDHAKRHRLEPGSCQLDDDGTGRSLPLLVQLPPGE